MRCERCGETVEDGYGGDTSPTYGYWCDKANEYVFLNREENG